MVAARHQPRGRAEPGMVGMRQFILLALLVAMVQLPDARPAPAQINRIAEIADYQGADREQRLIDGAKREKELTFYSSIPPEDLSVLAAPFDLKHAVKVTL